MRHLKKLNVELPIEVFHYDDELQDRDQRREINELGAEMISVGHASLQGLLGLKLMYPNGRYRVRSRYEGAGR